MNRAERVIDVIARMRGGYEPSDVLEPVDYIWADAIVETLRREGLLNEPVNLIREPRE
ncbi:MAG: hypothetical protein IPK79_01160 [Vampirovibrionales bacterium]|nr:hypothetical protein [Vampirovibrionales bacterium]MBK8200623.1 hypothetical protein [Acidobacteriota bacterium]